MTLRDPLFAPRITRPEHPDDSIALVSAESPAAVPLSILSEDEQLFRESITDFANREVRPLTRHMDEAALLDPALQRVELARDTCAQREARSRREEEPAGEESRRLRQEKKKRTKGDPGDSSCDRPDGGASYQDALFYLR